jgi:carbamate kinase
MGPKVDAACHFATKTGKIAAIGALADIGGIVRGEKGTLISTSFDAMTWHG